MAASDAITVEATARSLIEYATAHTDDPALTTAQVDLLVQMATSKNDAGVNQWTIADLNRMASLGWSWKASAAADQFEAGVGSGKTFKLQQQYDHAVQQAGYYGSGALSVVGSADASDGTSQRLTTLGTFGMTSVMNS